MNKRSGNAVTVRNGLMLLIFSTCGQLLASSLPWVAEGPGPNTRGQNEGIADGEVSGAINAVAPHPDDANILYLGAVNGGIWKTTNAMAAKPKWQPQTDQHRSLSIGALEFDPTDASRKTLAAGMGRFSSLLRIGGTRAGVLHTTDGGTTWKLIDGGGAIVGLNISGIAPRGNVITISANTADNPLNAGIWRTTDGGTTWTKISGLAGSGLPDGPAADLASDPADPKRLYTNAGPAGLFRSNDGGATWTKVSNAAMDSLIGSAGNVEISVGKSNNVYVAIVANGRLAGVFRSGDSGGSWTAMDIPAASDGGIHPGRQGGIHLSIAADLTNANIVYVGGDRQDSPFPNAIGARDFSGRLFRGDAAKPSGKQWVHLTHSKSAGPAGGGTANTSAPHADSRDMDMAANGVLIESDDGGVYRRTSPQTNNGDWFSMNGDIQVTEFHSVAWDTNCNLVIGGTQDTGTPAQLLPANVRWQSISTGDGGVVAVDDSSTPGFSFRYSSFQNLSGFRRQVFDAANVLQSQVSPSRIVVGGGAPFTAQFYTPVRLNSAAPARLILGGGNSVYESLDRADSIREIGPGITANGVDKNPIAYGAADNPNVLYVGSGSRVFVRTAAHPAPLVQSGSYTGGTVHGIAGDPQHFKHAVVIDAKAAYETKNAGDTWTDITGNLSSLGAGTLRSVTYSTSSPGAAVIVGADNGVFWIPPSGSPSWSRLGTGLPRAPVYHLEHDPKDDMVLAGTLGRGAWRLHLSTSPVEAQLVAQTTAANESPSNEAEAVNSPDAQADQAGQNNNESYQLRPGVVVDLSGDRVYLMNPDGGIDAVAIASGERIWHSDAAAMPLGVVDDLLVSRAEYTGEGSNMNIVALAPENGEATVTAALALPADVKPTINETAEAEFIARLRPADDAALISWQFIENADQGIPPGTTESLPGGTVEGNAAEATALETRTDSGTFRVNLTTGAASVVEGAEVTVHAMPEIAELPQDERLAGLGDRQFLSVDGKHVMVSEPGEFANGLQNYRLIVHERATGNQVGEVTSHLAAVAFIVADSRLIFETGPFLHRTGAALTQEPAKVRAIDLATGAEAWNRPIRDIEYRGPLPP
jgi:photosystem II stability/assembly factor-like uncharacterized protein